MLTPLKATLRPSHLTRSFTTTTRQNADFTHTIIGAGVVGIAIARQLAHNTNTPNTLLLERHSTHGTETSSRNSEVVHAGLYYPVTSHKAHFCIRGRHMLTKYCAQRGIPYKRLGKWILAQDDTQHAQLEKIATTAKALNVPTTWLTPVQAALEEPSIHAVTSILVSPETAIVDSHEFMQALLGDFLDAPNATYSPNSPVIKIAPIGPRASSGWRLHIQDPATGEVSEITTETIINAAGLGAVAVNNMIVPPEQHRKMFYAKGNYFSYNGPVKKRPSRLIYPVPTPGAGGLGTHLTLDMTGRMRFGPDVEWVDGPDNYAVNGDRLQQAAVEIKKYLSEVDVACLSPDYSGIRPKLAAAGTKGFQDFIIQKEESYDGWINLLGIESPGLTSSMGIAEYVHTLLYK